jgi:hypothetical protein
MSELKMIENYSYHEIIKRTSAAFGTLFNNIYIRHPDENEDSYSYIKVPLSYGPIQKFLARLDEKPDLRNRVSLVLPRMSFQVGQLSYDSTRKTSSIQTFKAKLDDGNRIVDMFMPVPYNLPLQLTIATKYNDDMFQIVEQIIPYFKPEYQLTVNFSKTLGDKKDIPIVLQSISPFDDNYEGSYSTRRFIQCTLSFVAKIYFYGPIPSADDTAGGKGLIKKVKVDYYNNDRVPSRVKTYTVTPKAIKDYNEDASLALVENITESSTSFEVANIELLQEDTYIQIESEVMLVQKIDGDVITVSRAQYDTSKNSYSTNTVINIIDTLDDELVTPPDEYVFNEETFDFDDNL